MIRVSILLSLLLISGCRRGDPYEQTPPGGEPVLFREYLLGNIRQVRYWGDPDKIRLQSGLIRLYPGNGTYLKKFMGTEVTESNPEPLAWSKETEGKFTFSPDSVFLLLGNDPDTVYYFKGHWENGSWQPPRMEQYDSVWYANPSYSMGVSGIFIYL